MLVAGAAFAQLREGTYKPATGSPVPWSINDHQTLIWGGHPYIPYGIRIDGTPEAVASAKAAGVTDVVVDLPASGIGWSQVIEALGKANMRYLVRVNSLAPMAYGFAVEPQSYRITGITESRQVDLDLPGATSAFVVVASKSDATQNKGERVPVINGKLSYYVKLGPQVEHVLLVYPEMTSYDQQDFWGDLDVQRDSLLAALKRNGLGAGLRGIINPMGKTPGSVNQQRRFVPISPYFQMELSKYLEDKYHSVVTVLRNWSVSGSNLSEIDDKTKKLTITFDQLARLVPMWSSNRGVSSLLDPVSNMMYPCDNRRSQIWDDITKVINSAEERRFARLVPAIRSVANVPIIQDWIGWESPFEVSNPSIDGVGMRAIGSSPSAIADSGCRAASSVLRWNTHGWLVATDFDLGTGAISSTQYTAALDALSSMGVRGVFVRTESTALMKAQVQEGKARDADTSSMNFSPQPVFFPENAYNPAVPQRLPGDHWWLPAPSDGNRIDLGTGFFAYRSGLSQGTFALWAKIPGRYRLVMNNPKTVRFQTMDGSDPMPKYEKDSVTLSISEFPLIISNTQEIPVPDAALLETMQRFELLLRVAESSHKENGQEEMSFNEAARGFQRNPGGSFDIMRKQYWILAGRVAPYSWIEGEHSVENNFSEVTASAGCSGGAALSLRTQVLPGTSGYFADYNVPVKTREEQEVWIAAKIPAERRGDVVVTLSGQTFRIGGEPLSLYGGGFGWYRLGPTRLAGNLAKLRFMVSSAGNSEVAIDTILVTPNPFTPSGITPPDPIRFPTVIDKPQKKSKRKGSGGS